MFAQDETEINNYVSSNFSYQNTVFSSETDTANSSDFPSSPFIFAINIYNTTCRYKEGGIAISVSNGTPPYQYKISNSPYWSNNGLFGNLSAGNYRVYARDAAGTIDSADVIITNTFEPPALSPPIGSLLFDCESTLPSYTLGISGGTSPYLFTYDFFTIQSSPTFTNLRPGLYSWAVKDANSCINVISANIYPSVVGSCNFGFGGAFTVWVCDSSREVMSVDGSYEGPVGRRDCLVSVDSGPYSLHERGYGPGVHTVVMLDTPTGKTASHVYTALHICKLKLEASSLKATCSGENASVKLTAKDGTAPYLFSSDGFNFSATDSFYNLKAGIYTFAVKDATGKVAFVLTEIEKNCPSLTGSAIPTNCTLANGSIQVTGSGGTTPYSYSINAVNFQVGNLFTGLAAGTYTVTIKDNLGFKDSVSVTVRQGTCFSVTLTTVNANCGQLGRITANAVNGVLPYSYSLDSIVFQPSNIFTVLPAGNYTVYIKDGNSVVVKVYDTIKGSSAPVFNLGRDTSLCKGKVVILSPDISYPGAGLVWSTGEASSSISVTASNDYWLKITSAEGCIWKDTIKVNFKDLPVFNLGGDTSVCEKDTLILNATVTNANNYLWSNGLVSSQIKAFQSNWYWCEVNKDGCKYRDSLQLIVKPNPFVNLGRDTTLCEGILIQLNAYNNNSIYQWQDNSIASTYNVKEENKYSVVVNKDGCIAKDTINVKYILKPNFDLGDDQLICSGQSKILKPSADTSWQFLWQDGSTGSSYTVTQKGTYSLVATNTCGTMRDEILFTEGICDIYIPSAFTPNGDRWNNEFKVSGTTLVTQFHLQIFNRYGQLVFETTDKNKGWDGVYKTLPAQAGAYVYVLQYKDNKRQQSLKGSFLLLR